MTTTPPLRIASIQEPPPAPRHGAWHDDFVPRYATRSSLRRQPYSSDGTPKTPRNFRAELATTTPDSNSYHLQSSQHKLSPPHSPHTSTEHNQIKRVQILSSKSPSSPVESRHTSSSLPLFTSSSSQPSFASDSTTMNSGMLPTPVKTPRKKSKSGGNIAGRVLFQEQPIVNDDIMPTPRRGRKSKRHNGFSLEAFDAENQDNSSSVQIFTDSRDHVPELDLSADNPFVDHPAGVSAASMARGSRMSKRRKFGKERKKDEEVERAIQQDDVMVYVFRGKKVFKRFDDSAEEEETAVDVEDFELLKQSEGEAKAEKLLRPLTRKSIKPTRLFQSEKQKRDREAEQDLTDIEEGRDVDLATSSDHPKESSAVKRRSSRNVTRMTSPPLDGDSIEEKAGSSGGEGRALEFPTPKEAETRSKLSPFNLWRRVKSGGAASTSAPRNSRKRTASMLEAGDQSSGSRKLRSH